MQEIFGENGFSEKMGMESEKAGELSDHDGGLTLTEEEREGKVGCNCVRPLRNSEGSLPRLLGQCRPMSLRNWGSLV